MSSDMTQKKIAASIVVLCETYFVETRCGRPPENLYKVPETACSKQQQRKIKSYETEHQLIHQVGNSGNLCRSYFTNCPCTILQPERSICRVCGPAWNDRLFD